MITNAIFLRQLKLLIHLKLLWELVQENEAGEPKGPFCVQKHTLKYLSYDLEFLVSSVLPAHAETLCEGIGILILEE